MSTRFHLPSGQQVTRYWSGGAFRYQLHQTDGVLTDEDAVALGKIAERSIDRRQEPEPPAPTDTDNPFAVCTCGHSNDVHGQAEDMVGVGCGFPDCFCQGFTLHTWPCPSQNPDDH